MHNIDPGCVCKVMRSFLVVGLVPERKRSKYCGKDDLYSKLKSPGRVSKIKRRSEKKTRGIYQK